MNEIDPDRKAQSVHLPDGGYLATFQVMHELHCIVSLLSASHYRLTHIS